VLSGLTRYLIQFQQVHVPTVGTLKLVQQPASLDVANKIIHPPQFTLRFSEDGWLTKHQLWYFGTLLEANETGTREALQDAGLQMRKAIERAAFTWNGLGTFTYIDHKIQFEPQLQEPVLQPVAAERVLREGVQHSVLVGDQVVFSNGTSEVIEQDVKHRNWAMVAGWAAVVLAIFFIVFYLYQHHFQSTATGLQNKIEAPQPAATYRQ
jgi:hypothetical protein